MLNSVVGALVKEIKIEATCWEVMKNDKFNFLKVKKLLNVKLLFFVFLTSALSALVVRPFLY